MTATPISFRPVGPDDEAFLLKVYGSTRSEELAAVPWTEAQREEFLKLQLAAQQQHYRSRYPTADHHIILADNVPVGRLYVARLDEQIRIADLALLPEARGRGIGTKIIKDLMAEAAAQGKPVRIYVESFNPSLRLFERLGFSKISEQDFYWLMEWRTEV
jgi:ribosomal protein S18 acetylase RimI-like enzyme